MISEMYFVPHEISLSTSHLCSTSRKVYNDSCATESELTKKLTRCEIIRAMQESKPPNKTITFFLSNIMSYRSDARAEYSCVLQRASDHR